MGPSDTDGDRLAPNLALTNRSLIATASLLALVALFACWFGAREVINGIVNYEGRAAAENWAEAFAHTLEDRNTVDDTKPISPYSGAANPARFIALDNAIFDGKIVGYRIYNRQGLIVATSNFMEIGNEAETPEMRQAIEHGHTFSRLVADDNAETISKALAPLIDAGNLKGAIQIEFDATQRAAQLNRLRYLAFGALAILLAAVMTILGFVVRRTLRRHKSVSRELNRNVHQHRRLLEEAPDSMVIHNTKQILYANAAAAALHGADSPEDLVGLNPDVLIPEHQDALIRKNRLKALRDGEVPSTETIGRRRLDGTVVQADTLGIPIEWNGESCLLIQSRDMTVTRAHQRRIAEREAQLSAFMENTQSVMFVKSLDGRLEMVNRKFEEFYGVSKRDVIGKKTEAWAEQSLVDQFVAEDRTIIATGTPESLEALLTRADGEKRTIRYEKFPIRDCDGAFAGIGCVSTDITDIKNREIFSRNAQARAEQTQAQLSAFMNHSPTSMYLKDRDLKITMVNRPYERFFGLTASEMIGSRVDKWLPKQVADEVDTLDLEILRTGEKIDMEAQLTNADGESRTLLYTKFPVYAPNGDIVGVGGINRDVTDQRRQEAEVKETQAQLSAYIDHIPMMVMLLDRDSRILMVNRQYEKFFDVTADEMIGTYSGARFNDRQRRIATEETAQVHHNLETSERIIPLVNAAGEERQMHTIKFPIVAGENIPVAVGVVLSDITEQRQHERELQSARDAAEAANRAKTAFLANMSHEIRTPMNGVFGMADLLAQSALSQDQQRYLNTIRRSGESLLGVINNVLDVSRIEAGEFRLDTATFNIHDVIADAVELFSENAAAKNIFIAHKVHDNVPRWVRGDSVRLRQVLINLIGNAIKFTKDGAVVVSAVRVGGTDGDALIRFEVMDTGIGIEREKIVSLFNPFQQADSSITRKYGGTGLGLSIANHIVKLMGGRIDIDSQPNEGSSFQFSIDLKIDAPRASIHDEPGTGLTGKRVLIVDDNAVNREILSEFVRGWDMDFAVAGNAADAKAAIDDAIRTKQPFDVALIDIVMPGLDGIALAEWIGRRDRHGRTKLIALTSFNWNRDSAVSRAAGFAEFATKPVRRVDLGRLIESAVADPPEADSGSDECREPINDDTFREPVDERVHAQTYSANVLVAEDNPVNMELVQEYLTRLGCTVVTAEDGRQAVDRYAGDDFHLIFMDVQMPGMDGIEATRRIRDLEARNGCRRIPIIAATAHAFQEDRQKCISAGMDDFLSKPFTAQDVAPILERWLESARTVPRKHKVPVPRDDQTIYPQRPSPDLLDETTIAQLRALDGSGENRIFAKVVGTFLDVTPGQLHKLEKHVAAEDFAGIALVAHSLKSSAANVSALSLSSLFQKMEIAGRNEDIETCATALDAVMALYDDVSEALRSATGDMPPNRRTA
tara:strand:+ start:11443 stop:15720 length:4278 start_codon:yes stop_codon:yes gene_type:complete